MTGIYRRRARIGHAGLLVAGTVLGTLGGGVSGVHASDGQRESDRRSAQSEFQQELGSLGGFVTTRPVYARVGRDPEGDEAQVAVSQALEEIARAELDPRLWDQLRQSILQAISGLTPSAVWETRHKVPNLIAAGSPRPVCYAKGLILPAWSQEAEDASRQREPKSELFIGHAPGGVSTLEIIQRLPPHPDMRLGTPPRQLVDVLQVGPRLKSGAHGSDAESTVGVLTRREQCTGLASAGLGSTGPLRDPFSQIAQIIADTFQQFSKDPVDGSAITAPLANNAAIAAQHFSERSGSLSACCWHALAEQLEPAMDLQLSRTGSWKMDSPLGRGEFHGIELNTFGGDGPEPAIQRITVGNLEITGSTPIESRSMHLLQVSRPSRIKGRAAAEHLTFLLPRMHGDATPVFERRSERQLATVPRGPERAFRGL